MILVNQMEDICHLQLSYIFEKPNLITHIADAFLLQFIKINNIGFGFFYALWFWQINNKFK